MAVEARTLLFCWLVPAMAGLGTGVIVMAPKEKGPPPISNETTASREEATLLPDDPATLKLAAMAGRTSDARKKIEALFAENAPDEEIAEWLAPILIADPRWLESFILQVHESRRIDLVRATIWKMAETSPDSVWELIRDSPFAAMASRTTGSDKEREGMDVLDGCHGSPLAAEVLFDPACGFSDEEVANYFRFETRSPENSRRVLEEWFAGRWEGDPPKCVRTAWMALRWMDEPALRELQEQLPGPLKAQADRFETLAKLSSTTGMITEDPSPEELGMLGEEELSQFAGDRAEAGRPLPLELLAKLPSELRGGAIASYFAELYPFNRETAEHALEVMDDLGFTRDERQSLLDGAVHQTWSFSGDYQAALGLIAKMPDREAAAQLEGEILKDLAFYDPERALKHVETMPDGELKVQIEMMAKEGLP